jgi:hypothetical protein
MARRLGIVALWVTGALVFLASPWVPTPCPVRLLLHIPCPSCGLTRAARSILHLDFAEATRLHPLWWLVFPYLGLLVALETWTYVRTGALGEWTRRPVASKAGLTLIALLVIVWGARFMGMLGGPVAI